MKVGFHTSQASKNHQGRGIGFYSVNLLQGLSKVHDLEVTEFSSLDNLKAVDLVHYPTFDFFQRTLPLKKRFPTVVTIHDVTPLLFPKHYPSGIRGKINLAFQKLSLKSVKGIITDSECSKKDIQKVLGISASKIQVIYLAAGQEFNEISDQKKLNDIKNKYHLPEKFALFAGNVNWNKNILNQAQSCIEAKIDLVLAGKSFEKKDDLNHPELKSFKEFLKKYSNNSLIHILGYVPTTDLVGIYNLASVTLLVSFYEGFGLPILESQACSTLVITSNISSMPEVAGNGAILVDPNNVAEIRDAIIRVTSDQNLRKDLIEKGFKNVKKFSWEKTAEDTINVYKQVVKE